MGVDVGEVEVSHDSERKEFVCVLEAVHAGL